VTYNFEKISRNSSGPFMTKFVFTSLESAAYH